VATDNEENSRTRAAALVPERTFMDSPTHDSLQRWNSLATNRPRKLSRNEWCRCRRRRDDESGAKKGKDRREKRAEMDFDVCLADRLL